MMKNLSAVIIGSRPDRHLKTPTPLLPFGDSTVLGRTLQAYLSAGVSELILVLGYRSAEVQAALEPIPDKVQIVVDPNADAPYGELLRRGCERISSSAKAFALGLGDQPLLDKALIEELAARFVSTKAKILVPAWQGMLGHPVLFEASFAQEFRKLRPEGEVWDVLKANAGLVTDYHVYHTAVVRHVDDMDDYYALLRLAGLPVPEKPPVLPRDEEKAGQEPAQIAARLQEAELGADAKPES